MSINLTSDTFGQLRAWLDALPDQVEGQAGPLTINGDGYHEFFSFHLVRPGDELIGEAAVASNMKRVLESYFSSNSGAIHWRIPLETEIQDAHVVLRAGGPDMDYITNTRCTKDKNWKRVAAYCRVFREKHKKAA